MRRAALYSSADLIRRSLRLRWLLLIATALTVALLYTQRVETAPTPADRTIARELLADVEVSRIPAGQRTFEQEVQLILAVQNAVLQAAPVDEGLPLGSQREPEDIVAVGKGLCFDRSRAIEKLLKVVGFETRHAAVYSTRDTGSSLVSLLTPQVDSHAVSEAKTSRGWILIDSNARWIGLSGSGAPYKLAALRDGPLPVEWHDATEADINPIFTAPFTWVYGMYSRHGQFYPPFTPVPDVNWAEFAYNLPTLED